MLDVTYKILTYEYDIRTDSIYHEINKEECDGWFAVKKSETICNDKGLAVVTVEYEKCK